jgi:hypothetical protein
MRPAARHYDSLQIAEVSRLVTNGTPHAASMLYAACARVLCGARIHEHSDLSLGVRAWYLIEGRRLELR